MKLSIAHQENYSRGELLLRSFFGFIYMTLPHAFLLFFCGIWSGILTFISFWIILFTGKYPQSFFEYQVGLIRWQTRLNARFYNLADGYPAFGIDAIDDAIQVDVPYPQSTSRGLTILRLLFGWLFVWLPHGFVLLFLSIGVNFAVFIGWWVILFTGRLPEGIHNFITGVMRWSTRVGLYMSYMTDTYPPFSLD